MQEAEEGRTAFQKGKKPPQKSVQKYDNIPRLRYAHGGGVLYTSLFCVGRMIK